MPTKLSDHAQDMMIIRGISLKEVEDAIKKGSKQLQKPDKILAYYRHFCVVFRRVGNINYVITVKPR